MLRTLIVLAGGLLSISAFAADRDPLDIKGFHVGMQRWEVEAHKKDFCFQHQICGLPKKTRFTVGGVIGKFSAATYDNDAASTLVAFSFDSLKFSELQAALMGKYPQASCQNSQAVTRLGLHVPQVICHFETNKDGIYLIRVLGNINTSELFLMSAEKKREFQEYIAARNKDM